MKLIIIFIIIILLYFYYQYTNTIINFYSPSKINNIFIHKKFLLKNESLFLNKLLNNQSIY